MSWARRFGDTLTGKRNAVPSEDIGGAIGDLRGLGGVSHSFARSGARATAKVATADVAGGARGSGLASVVSGLRPQRSRMRDYDQSLLWVVIALLAFGLVMVFSASIAMPDSPKYASYRETHFLARHLLSLAVGAIGAICAFRVPVKTWDKYAPKLFLAALVMLIVVLIPHVGKGVNGARRWIPLGVTNMQPSEIMKLAVTIYAANYTVRKQEYMQSFLKGFLPMAFAVGVVGTMLLLEPDMGAFMVIAAIAMGVLFLGGVSARLFGGLSLTAVGTFALLVWASPWRRERIFAYLNPWEERYAQGKAYQLTHSLIAFGRGEWFGVGLGGSVEKLNYLPEAHTDFILAVIGEELGFVGVVIVILLFYWIVRRAFEIGRQALALERTFAGLVAKGIGIWIGVQCFINMGVNLGLLPTKGLTLPLVSYGGSGILLNCVAMAVLMRVDYENRVLMRGGKV
jgi:cell division protein FtsW